MLGFGKNKVNNNLNQSTDNNNQMQGQNQGQDMNQNMLQSQNVNQEQNLDQNLSQMQNANQQINQVQDLNQTQELNNSPAMTQLDNSTQMQNTNQNFEYEKGQGEQFVVDMNENKADGDGKVPVKIRFKYAVKDKDGKVKNGVFDAYSKVDVHTFLTSQGYEIVNIEEDKMSTKFGLAKIGSQKRMKAKDLNFFLTQLSTYIKSGIPLVDAVAILERQTKKKNEKLIFQKLVFELTKGSNFSQALEEQSGVFPKLVINMVKTSELTGDLTAILDDLADYYKEQNATRKQIISAMTYPSVVFVFAIAIISFIYIYVVPQFVGIFDQLGMDLPLITKVIIGISNFMRTSYLLIIAVVILIIGTLVFLYKKVQPVRRVFQSILMRIPVVSKIIMYNEVIMFTSTFGSLVNHDVFITDSMEILKTISNNEIYKELIAKAVDNLSIGEGLSKAFENHWAFPSTAYEMLVTGEKTGRLGPMMNNVADYYREEQKALVTQLKSLIEPIMIVFLAIIVGTTLLSIVIPMFSMYGGVLD